jgi:Ca-activated chloride channel family protein
MKKILLSILLGLVSIGAFAGEMGLVVTLSNPVVLTGGRQTNYIRVGLTGFAMAAKTDRPQVNAALVLDVSGSMSGEKMQQSVQAAHTAIDMLKNGDVLSIVAYSDYARVVIPATVITSWNREQFHSAVNRLEADGSTALFDGVSLGAQELARHYSPQKVNRVILLSDGQANVGPSSPYELGNLGEVLRRQGITVSTIGLGNDYNADLMYELAARSDGNHVFVESPRMLASIFEKEFSSLMAVVAQNVEIIINCAAGVKPVRVLNRDGEIRGSQIVLNLNQVYSEQEQYVIIEVEMEPGRAGEQRDAAGVSVNYLNMESKKKSQIGGAVKVSFTEAPQEVAAKKDKETLADVTLQIATQQNLEAVRLRDEGKIQEAEELLFQNADMLQEAAEDYDAPALGVYAEQNRDDAAGVTGSDWEKSKKQMRESQHSNATQQIY